MRARQNGELRRRARSAEVASSSEEDHSQTGQNRRTGLWHDRRGDREEWRVTSELCEETLSLARSDRRAPLKAAGEVAGPKGQARVVEIIDIAVRQIIQERSPGRDLKGVGAVTNHRGTVGAIAHANLDCVWIHDERRRIGAERISEIQIAVVKDVDREVGPTRIQNAHVLKQVAHIHARIDHFEIKNGTEEAAAAGIIPIESTHRTGITFYVGCRKCGLLSVSGYTKEPPRLPSQIARCRACKIRIDRITR